MTEQNSENIAPPPMPMIFANGHALTKNGGPVPKDAVLKARIDDYISEDSAEVEDAGAFDFLKVTPPDPRYVGMPMVFQVDVPGVGVVDAEEQHTFQPQQTEFGITLTFDVAVTQPTPAPEPPPAPSPVPGDSPPPMPMILAQGHAVDKQGGPAPRGAVLRGKVEGYVTESSSTIENEGYFDFLKVTPPNESYVGKALSFQLDVPNVGIVESETSIIYQPRETDFGTRISFDLGTPTDTPTPGEPAPEPTPTEPPPAPTPTPSEPMPTPPAPKSLWQRIIDAIKRLFGLGS